MNKLVELRDYHYMMIEQSEGDEFIYHVSFYSTLEHTIKILNGLGYICDWESKC